MYVCVSAYAILYAHPNSQTQTCIYIYIYIYIYVCTIQNNVTVYRMISQKWTVTKWHPHPNLKPMNKIAVQELHYITNVWLCDKSRSMILCFTWKLHSVTWTEHHGLKFIQGELKDDASCTWKYMTLKVLVSYSMNILQLCTWPVYRLCLNHV